MQSLYILRHGQAVAQGTPGFADDDRPLTEKGEKQMHQVAKGLRRLKLDLDRIVTSPLPRAQRTAEIVAEVLDLEDRLETSDALRTGQGASSIRDWLANRSEARLMIVGHNPGLSDLVTLLATKSTANVPFCNLEKGGLAAFRFDESNPEWIELQWLTTPKLIRRLLD
ncbi:histidine phosphatase family protein [soil metagenome]